ncbi:MAG: hypothetical protein HRU33_22460 [Rhodobacteraceae bacterium]|nr:hypothetical protein [Paracoccaceae bacterium]
MQIGIEVVLAELRDKLGLNAPKAGAQILGRPAPPPPNPRFAGSEGNQNPSETSVKYHLKGLKGKFQGEMPLSRLKSPQWAALATSTRQRCRGINWGK